MQIHPKKLKNNTIAVPTGASPLIAPMLGILLMTLTKLQTHLPLLLPTNPTTALAINLALVKNVMPACQGFVTNVISAKTPAILNGLTAKCTIWPLVLKWPKILMSCTNPHNLLNLIHHLLLLLIVLIHHHAGNMILTPPIMLMIVATPSNASAPAVALAVIHGVVIVMMMIDAVIDPLVLALITTTLLTTVHQAVCLTTLCCNLMVLAIWHGKPTQTPAPTIPFILTAKANVKTLSWPLIALHLIWMMTQMSHLTVEEKQPQLRLPPLTSTSILTPKPTNTAFGITSNWTHNPHSG